MTTETALLRADPWLPVSYWVAANHRESADTATLILRPEGVPIREFLPGQFTMLYAYGIGEVPISISGDPADDNGLLVHTIRGSGAVSRALQHAAPGTIVGVRGPFGAGWNLSLPAGTDLVLVAGGIGLAPLRPALLHALRHRRRFGRIVLVAGAKSPAELLFTEELAALADRSDVELVVTVDRAPAGWAGRIGLVTKPLAELVLAPERTVALLCGPELMMRFSAKVLLDHGMDAGRIQVSLDRNMKCDVALCGHCQSGPLVVCRDGPVGPTRLPRRCSRFGSCDEHKPGRVEAYVVTTAACSPCWTASTSRSPRRDRPHLPLHGSHQRLRRPDHTSCPL